MPLNVLLRDRKLGFDVCRYTLGLLILRHVDLCSAEVHTLYYTTIQQKTTSFFASNKAANVASG